MPTWKRASGLAAPGPHCGGAERNRKMQGKSTRIGVYKCYDCRKPFTVNA